MWPTAQQELSDATHGPSGGRGGVQRRPDQILRRQGGRRRKRSPTAEKELADARRKVADIDTCEWYILSRDSNPGYLGFGQDADRMGNLASVFPVLFFLVAALVCLTTMTRMVEDQRVQIGCLKALGYSRLDHLPEVSGLRRRCPPCWAASWASLSATPSSPP